MKNVSYLELDDTSHQGKKSPSRPQRKVQKEKIAQTPYREQPNTMRSIGTTHVGLSLSESGDIQTMVKGVDAVPRTGVENFQKYLKYTLGQASDFSFEETSGTYTSTLTVVYRYLGNDAGTLKAPILSLQFELPNGSRKLKNALMSSLKEVLPTSESVITPEKKATLQQFSDSYEESIPSMQEKITSIQENITAQAAQKINHVSNTFKSSFKEVLDSVRNGLQGSIFQTPKEKSQTSRVDREAPRAHSTSQNVKEPITIHVQAKEVVEETQETVAPPMTAQMEEFSNIVTSVENAVHKEEMPILKNISGIGNSFMKYLVQASKSFFMRKGADRASLVTATEPVRSKLKPWVSKNADPEQGFMRGLVSRVARIFTGAAKRGQDAHKEAVSTAPTERVSVFSRAKAQFFRLLDSVTLNNQAPLKNPTRSESTRFATVARTKTSAAFVNGEATGNYRPASASNGSAQASQPSRVNNTTKAQTVSKNPIQTSKTTQKPQKAAPTTEKPSTTWQKLSRWTKNLFVAR